ncbi:MAG: nucleoid-associated protein [Myxococcota bacterium]
MEYIPRAEVDALAIESMIFHVVGTGERPVFLGAPSNVQDHGGFFLERVKETLGGRPFAFAEGSETAGDVAALFTGPEGFEATSRVMAERFHALHPSSSKPGVLMVFALRVGGSRAACLIKYDHLDVLTYEELPEAVRLARVERSFVESSRALQKTAFFAKDALPRFVARDRLTTGGADYWLAFLGAERARDEERELTSELAGIARALGREARTLPQEAKRELLVRARDYAEREVEFDDEVFLTELVGAQPESSEVRSVYESLVEASPLAGRSFTTAKKVIRPRAKHVLKSREGVTLRVPYEVQIDREVFEARPLPDGRTEIRLRLTLEGEA